MNKFIPFEKLSKKQQKSFNTKKRKGWGNTNPITKKIESKRVYNRKKIREVGDISQDLTDFLRF